MDKQTKNHNGARGRPRKIDPNSFVEAWMSYQADALSSGVKPLWKDFCAQAGITARRGRQIRTAYSKTEKNHLSMSNGPDQSGNNETDGTGELSARHLPKVANLKIPVVLAEEIQLAFRGHGSHQSIGLSVRAAVLRIELSEAERLEARDVYDFVMNVATGGRQAFALEPAEVERCQRIAALAEATCRGRFRTK